MSFCTNCGANVNGAFCGQCGTPVRAAGSQAAPPAAPAAQAPAPAPVPDASAPARRKTSPLVWVLIVVLGLFVLGGIAVAGIGWYVARHSGEALVRLVTAGNPNVEVVRTDRGARSITVRDKRTGKETTLSFEDIKNGKIKIMGETDDGGTASIELGSEATLPSWVPKYPNATANGTFAVRGDNAGDGRGGSFSFTTNDSTSAIVAFYREKANEAGMKFMDLPENSVGKTMVISDEGSGRTIRILISSGTVTVLYAEKR